MEINELKNSEVYNFTTRASTVLGLSYIAMKLVGMVTFEEAYRQEPSISILITKVNAEVEPEFRISILGDWLIFLSENGTRHYLHWNWIQKDSITKLDNSYRTIQINGTDEQYQLTIAMLIDLNIPFVEL